MNDLMPEQQLRLRRAIAFLDDQAPIPPELGEMGAPYVRSKEPRRNRTWIAVSAAMALVVVTIGLFFRPQEANAYWAAVPSPPDPALVVAASALCPKQIGIGELPPLVLVDQRANAARALFGVNEDDTSSLHLCTLIRDVGEWTAPPVEELPFQVYTFVGGGFPPEEITKVVIDQTDGVRVEASMTHGFFHFWWVSPGGNPGGTGHFLDANGVSVHSFEVPPEP